jgi:ribosomal protein L15E
MISTSGIGQISLKGQGFRIARPGEAMAARALAFRKKKNYITVIIQLLWALRMLNGLEAKNRETGDDRTTQGQVRRG